MLPAQNLRPESLLFVLATESRALNVVATSATTICFVSRNLIPKAKEIIKQKSHTPYYDKSNAKALLTSAYQKSFPYLPEGRKKPPLCKGSLLFVQTYLFANHHKVFVVLNLVLASTAFVDTKAKPRTRRGKFYLIRLFLKFKYSSSLSKKLSYLGNSFSKYIVVINSSCVLKSSIVEKYRGFLKLI